MADGAEEYLAFDVTIVNGSEETYDPAFFLASMQSGNTEAEEIFDSENGFEGSPSTSLLPGREAEFRIGFGVSDPDDLVMEVAPGFEYDAAVFTS